MKKKLHILCVKSGRTRLSSLCLKPLKLKTILMVGQYCLYPSRFFILCFTFLIFSKLHSQAYSINNDLQRINIAMFETQRLFMDIDYNLYFDDQIKSQIHGIIKKDGRLLYQQVGEITVVKNEDYSVFVNNDEKLLVVDPNPKLKNPIKKEDLLRINVDTLKSWILKSELSSNSNKNTIVFTLKRGEYSRIIIDYDPNTYFLFKMELHARESYTAADQTQYTVKMEILFNKMSTEEQFSIDDFSENKYVIIGKKNKVDAVGTFRTYRLINNLEKTIKYDRTN